jgi:hypothetical protein
MAEPEPQTTEQTKIPEGAVLKGIGKEFNEIPLYENYELGVAFTLPLNERLNRYTKPDILKLDPKVCEAINLAEQYMGINDATSIEFLAGRQTVLICSFLAGQLGLSPDEIVQNFTPKEGEQRAIFLTRLVVWQNKMMEKLSQQK